VYDLAPSAAIPDDRNVHPSPYRNFLAPLISPASLLPVSISLGIVVLILLAGVLVSRSRNEQWKLSSSQLSIDLPSLGTDPVEGDVTEAMIHNCELSPVKPCGVEDSDSVHLIRQSNLPTVASQLLNENKYRYSSVYMLFRALSIENADDEVVELASSQEFTFTFKEIALFASRWYLGPALQYIRLNRTPEALTRYKPFEQLMLTRTSRDEWFAAPGIDLSDIAVLTSIFCTSERPQCVTGMLITLANMSSGFADDLWMPYKVLPFANRYSSLPDVFQSNLLTQYLKLLIWDGKGEIPQVPKGISASQEQAFDYAIGDHFRLSALDLADLANEKGCNEARAEAAVWFKRAQVNADPTLFRGPISRQMDFLKMKDAHWCDLKLRFQAGLSVDDDQYFNVATEKTNVVAAKELLRRIRSLGWPNASMRDTEGYFQIWIGPFKSSDEARSTEDGVLREYDRVYRHVAADIDTLPSTSIE
jgi:hypothetical protein